MGGFGFLGGISLPADLGLGELLFGLFCVCSGLGLVNFGFLRLRFWVVCDNLDHLSVESWYLGLV